jgi:hypothetical protein
MPISYDREIMEFCCTAGIPASVFCGRVVGPGEPLWLADDRRAALEYQAYKKSLCPGCQRPRSESFDVGMDDAYSVVALQCHACAARDRRAYNTSRDAGTSPLFGRYYLVTPEPVNGHDG